MASRRLRTCQASHPYSNFEVEELKCYLTSLYLGSKHPVKENRWIGVMRKRMRETSGEGGPLDWGYGKKDEGLLEAPTRANLLINAGDSQSPSRFQVF